MSTTQTAEDMWVAKHLAEATKRAKMTWGTAGWLKLTPEMRNAYICQNVVAILASIDFSDTYSVTSDPAKLFTRLITIGKLCDVAVLENGT